MQCDIKTFYNGVVTANLPNYNQGIRLNVDCNTLNLGIFQAGPPHGFQNTTISADNIYAKNTSNYYVRLNNGARLYCGNFCDVSFHVKGYGTNEPVMLINNYQPANSSFKFFEGGLTRIGRLNFQGVAIRPSLINGACLFINNVVLNGAVVNNSLLFVGRNVTWTPADRTVVGNGLIVNLANWRDHESAVLEHINGKVFSWNVWDSGPWGSQSLFDFCTNV